MKGYTIRGSIGSVLAGSVVAAALLASCHAALAARAYIGTFTGKPGQGHGEGIYLVNIDDQTGIPSPPRLAARTQTPSWMELSRDHRFLYTINGGKNYGPDKTGSVTVFAVAADGSLKKINTVSSGSPGPAYISLHPSGKFVMVANYAGGSFVTIRIEPDGSLGAIADVVKPTGPLNPPTVSDSPPGQLRLGDHSGSHCHMIGPDPSGQYVIGDDAGRDQIFVWKLDTDSGKLNEVSLTKSLPGSAPRHFVFSPDGKTMYQLQERDSRLATYAFANGHLTLRGPTISLLPAGFEGTNTSSELLIDKAGKHLYAGNRGHDSVATLTIGADGMPRHVADVPTGGDWPRSLTLDPTGRFLYALNQNGDNVTTFTIGPNGAANFTGHYMALGGPAVMVFLP